MYKIKLKDMKVPAYIWTEDGAMEAGTLRQIQNLSMLRSAFHHIVLCPDGHQGYGMPIGGVLATKGTIIPNAVGVDIGCGMCAVKTSLTDISRSDLESIKAKIRLKVPVGFHHHELRTMWSGFKLAPTSSPIVQQELQASHYQLGTLGGGNHFMEIQQDQADGRIWLMLHSGSRNFGLKIAKYYNTIAKKACDMWDSDIPNTDLAFLPLDSEEGIEYINAMEYALKFAKESRRRMMFSMINTLKWYYHVEHKIKDLVECDTIIDVHHNYARMENHFGHNVMVHRKGAISARKGETGIIPGSQGTLSYIVEGLGNPDSFMSCSHGAGRRMSRTQARKELDFVAEVAKLEETGTAHCLKHPKQLDEAPGAYKDIEDVMANQSDLVKIVAALKPLATIKSGPE